jgi:hypothetical protein
MSFGNTIRVNNYGTSRSFMGYQGGGVKEIINTGSLELVYITISLLQRKEYQFHEASPSPLSYLAKGAV